MAISWQPDRLAHPHTPTPFPNLSRSRARRNHHQQKETRRYVRRPDRSLLLSLRRLERTSDGTRPRCRIQDRLHHPFRCERQHQRKRPLPAESDYSALPISKLEEPLGTTASRPLNLLFFLSAFICVHLRLNSVCPFECFSPSARGTQTTAHDGTHDSQALPLSGLSPLPTRIGSRFQAEVDVAPKACH